MKLSKVNDALNHKITGGSEYQWNCYPDGRYLDYESDFANASVIYNPATQEIYQAEISHKDEAIKPYRWLNPAFKDAYYSEAKERNCDPNQAWDDTKWVDLETPDDFLDKATAMFNGKDFDPRVIVPLELDDFTVLQLALEAHKRDITLNKMVEVLLKEVIDRAGVVNEAVV